MSKYLGEFDVNIKDTPYANYTPADWVLEFIFRYGQIDGSHHKQWVIDQTAQILHGTPVIVKLAKWDDGNEEYRIWLDEPTQKYHDWVKLYRGEWVKTEYHEGFEYSYDQGIAP